MQIRNFDKFNNRKVTIMGLGIGGAGAARFFARLGWRVTVTDKKPASKLKPFLQKLTGLPIRYVLGRHHMRDFTHADLVVCSIGLRTIYKRLEDSPYLAAAIKHHVPLDTDVGIFFELVPREQIIGVTGTRGKSTTAALIAALLKTKNPKTVLAGNIRTSVFEVLPKIKKGTPVVLELSSWQLEGLAQHKKSPHVAVVPSIFKDHLNTYKNFHEYCKAKKNILCYQKKEDYAVLDEAIKQYREFLNPCGKARRIWTLRKGVPKWAASACRLPGVHNLSNLSAALAVAKLYRIPKPSIRRALKTFRGLEGRLEYIGVKRGAKFYNDTTATTPDAVIVALRSFPNPNRIILITGGVDKNLDYIPLANFLAAYPPKAIIALPGTATDKLLYAMQSSNAPKPHVKLSGGSGGRVIEVCSMREAVCSAWRIAKKGDIILLSPGAISFNLFQNEFDRGEQFVKAIKKLT